MFWGILNGVCAIKKKKKQNGYVFRLADGRSIISDLRSKAIFVQIIFALQQHWD